MNTEVKGFSLLELLIVVLIIGILAAIALPNFRNAQIRANIAQSQASMKSLDTAYQQFRIDRGVMLVDDIDFAFDVGKKRIQEKLNNIGINGVPGRTFFPLTTPIAYISQLPQDPFSQNIENSFLEAAGLFNVTAVNTIHPYSYEDNDPEIENDDLDLRQILRRNDLSTGKSFDFILLEDGDYWFIGNTPNTITGSGSVGVLDFHTITKTAVDLRGRNIVFNSTNGLFSRGTLLYLSREGFVR